MLSRVPVKTYACTILVQALCLVYLPQIMYALTFVGLISARVTFGSVRLHTLMLTLFGALAFFVKSL